MNQCFLWSFPINGIPGFNNSKLIFSICLLLILQSPSFWINTFCRCPCPICLLCNQGHKNCETIQHLSSLHGVFKQTHSRSETRIEVFKHSPVTFLFPGTIFHPTLPDSLPIHLEPDKFIWVVNNFPTPFPSEVTCANRLCLPEFWICRSTSNGGNFRWGRKGAMVVCLMKHFLHRFTDPITE